MSAFRISFNYRFEAAHRFTKSCAETCATPHGHTWHAKALFRAPDNAVNSDDMVMEFADLKRAWKAFIKGTVDHSFLHHHDDPLLPALKQHIPKFRGLPFPGDPTTELIAALFFAKLDAMTAPLLLDTMPAALSRDSGTNLKANLGAAKSLRPIGVVVRETPTNIVTFKVGPGGRSDFIERINSRFTGWWNSPDPETRTISFRG